MSLGQGAAMETVWRKARDGYRLNLHVWEAPQAKAVVQILHGMEEHQGRYAPFAEFLHANGFSVVSSDMRGHGASAGDLGYFKDDKGDLELIEDQRSIREWIEGRFPGLPVYLFAHSMGTITARVLLQQDSRRYEKAVLSGYPNYQAAAGLGILLADLIKALRGPKYKSALLQWLSVGSFNRRIENPRTDCDWICRREETVREYIEDPCCGFGFTCSAFGDLFRLVWRMHQPKRYERVNRELAILFLRGRDDPCVGGDRGAEDSRRVLSEAGFSQIRHIDYPDMRHEILNERDRRRVYEDILAFYSQRA